MGKRMVAAILHLITNFHLSKLWVDDNRGKGGCDSVLTAGLCAITEPSMKEKFFALNATARSTRRRRV